MKPNRFHQAVIDLHGRDYGARRWFCGIVGCDERTAGRWFSGELEPPRYAVVIVKLLQEVKRLTGELPVLK